MHLGVLQAVRCSFGAIGSEIDHLELKDTKITKIPLSKDRGDRSYAVLYAQRQRVA